MLSQAQQVGPSANRQGATLLEVLIAIFVMAIGLMALLTLFPLGVLTMMQSIQDERVAQAGANATCLAQATNIRQDPLVVQLMQNPNASVFANAPVVPTGVAHSPPCSYPVMIDPVGSTNYLHPYNQWIGGFGQGIPRTGLSFINSPQQLLQNGTLLDDILFGQQGLPNSPVERDGKYSWSYLVQRPHFLDASVVDLTVIVYANRPLGLGGNGAAFLQPDETVYQANFDTTQNLVTLTWGASQVAPAVNVGNWILDSTPVQAPTNNYAPSHARFYRVVGMTQTAATTLALELQTPIVVTAPFTANSSTNTGTVIVLGGVVDVFQKGDGWMP